MQEDETQPILQDLNGDKDTLPMLEEPPMNFDAHLNQITHTKSLEHKVLPLDMETPLSQLHAAKPLNPQEIHRPPGLPERRLLTFLVYGTSYGPYKLENVLSILLQRAVSAQKAEQQAVPDLMHVMMNNMANGRSRGFSWMHRALMMIYVVLDSCETFRDDMRSWCGDEAEFFDHFLVDLRNLIETFCSHDLNEANESVRQALSGSHFYLWTTPTAFVFTAMKLYLFKYTSYSHIPPPLSQ
mgnify:CR=1 FL=1